eukprot:8011714-Pyramimonas_sp.AAC.1
MGPLPPLVAAAPLRHGAGPLPQQGAARDLLPLPRVPRRADAGAGPLPSHVHGIQGAGPTPDVFPDAAHDRDHLHVHIRARAAAVAHSFH